MLSYLEDEDPALVTRIFDRRGRRRLDQARRRTDGLSLDAKVPEVARILDEDGYLAEFESVADGTYVITEHNCAVLAVANKYRLACTSELEFLQALLPEAEVKRIKHMIGGHHVCAYSVTPL